MGFPNSYQQNETRIIYTTAAASGSANGWMSGTAALQFTGTFSGTSGRYWSVYIATSGANGIAAGGKFVDGGIPLFTLPTLAANSSFVIQIGPGVSGTSTAQTAFYSMIPPLNPTIWVDPGAGASNFRITVVSRN